MLWMVDVRKQMDLSRLSRAFRRRTPSFWGCISGAIAAMCVFSIFYSSLWTYKHRHSAASVTVPGEHVLAQNLPTVSVRPTPRDTLQRVLPDEVYTRVTTPVLEVDYLRDSSSYEGTEPIDDVLIGNMTEVIFGPDSAPMMASEPMGPEPVEDVLISNMIEVVIGVLSEPIDDADFRAAARATWVKSAKASPDHAVEAAFFFTHQHSSDPALRQEAKLYGDIVFGPGGSKMPAAYQMLELLSQQYAAHHILRVNVRSYVVVNRLLARLEALCELPGCVGEDIWAGRMITSRAIPGADTHYVGDTGLSMYLPYMSSDAYVLSTTLAQSLALMHTDIGLKLYGREDISLGVWMIPMAARRIDLGSAIHIESACCFDASGVMTLDICARKAEQYPVIMSVLEEPEYLESYHDALSTCPDQRMLV